MAYKETYPKVNCSQYQADFIYYELPKDPKDHLKIIDPLAKLKTPLKPKQFDLSSLSRTRDSVYVPFGLLHRHKETVQTNPHEDIPESKLADIFFENKLKARKIRPRVYKLPQIPLDEVDEDIMYKGEKPLADYIYSNLWKDATKFCEKYSFLNQSNPVKAKLDRKDILDKSLECVRMVPESDIPKMDYALKKYARNWEKHQPNVWVDNTKMFWKGNNKLGLCSLCNPPPKHLIITDEEQEEIDKCTKTNTFGLAYTLMHSSYTGYLPNCPVGVPYTKKIFKKHDPYVTTLMEMHGSYRK